MIDYAAMLELVRRDDDGLLLLVNLTVIATLIVLYLIGKHRRWLTTLERFGPVVLPITTFVVYPALGIPAAVCAWCSTRFQLPRRIHPLAFILLIGLLLRLPLLNDSLWFDESFTATLVNLPVSQIPAAILSDVHPPLYYALLWVWVQIAGSSPLALRLPSLLLSLVSIYLVYRLALGLKLTRSAALWAAALAATLPAALFYSGEARPYALLTVLVLLGMVSVLEKRVWDFAFVMLALPLTHNIGYLYMGALALGCFILNWSDKRRWLLPVLIGGLAGLTWLPGFLIQSRYVQDGFWAYISAGAIVRPLFKMTVGIIGEPYSLQLVVPASAITVASLWALRSWLKTAQGALWLLVVFVPLLLVAAASVLWRPVFVFRHFLPAVLILASIAWGYALSRSRLAVQVMASVIALSLIAFFAVGLSSARPDYRLLLQEYCPDADRFYATSITSAFITSANDERPTLTWPGAQDNGLTITQDVLPNFNIRTGDLSDLQGETVCIMQIDRPETQQSERAYLAILKQLYPVRTSVFHISYLNDLYFHILGLEVEG